METVSHWMHVDLFTVDQAAALWAGFDPARVSIVDSFKPSEVVAASQMLIAAVIGGVLPYNSEGNYLSSIGDHSRSLVSRAALETFARERHLFPAFLFDTLAPFESGGGILDRQQVPRAQAIQADLPSPPANRGGRPQEHDWDSFVMEIIWRANQPDGLPDTQAELIRDMLTWFQQSYAREPAESAVKERTSKIFKYMSEAKNRKG